MRNLYLAICLILILIIEQFLEYNKKFNKFRYYINKIMKIIFVVGIIYYIFLYLGIYNVSNINNFVKNWVKLITDFEKNEQEIYYSQIKNNCLLFRDFFKYYILCYVIYKIVKLFSYSILHRFQRRAFKNEILSNKRYINELYQSLYHYLSNKNDKFPILIIGAWGVGKTHFINNFIDKYYRYVSQLLINNQKIYKISCFGVTTKENFIKTIEETCENADNSIFNKFLSIIEKTPIVGSFLKKVLEKKYDINNLKENSVFIFDNFERISPCIKDIEGNIKNEYEVLSKYDIVTSIIDELIEKYNMKVIIVVDETKIIYEYLENTFIHKLGCKWYRINKESTVFEEIWNEIIQKDKRIKKYKNKLERIFIKIKYDTQEIWKFSKNRNTRILYKCLYNYIYFYIWLVERKYKFDSKNNEEIGIFYTNLIINITSIEDENNYFNKIIAGENLVEYVEEMENILEDSVNSGMYILFGKIDIMWYSNNEDIDKWRNLEQNYYFIKENIRKIKSKFNDIYITKFNYKDKEIKIGEEINFNILCKVLSYNDEYSLKLANEILEKCKITFIFEDNYKSSNILVNKIYFINQSFNKYNIIKILEENLDVLIKLFEVFKKEIDDFENIVKNEKFEEYNIQEFIKLFKIYTKNL